MVADDLLRFLFDGRPHALRRPVAAWLAGSRRFFAFVVENQAKIRKKLRTATEPDTLRGLELELETACLLLRERALTVVYEPHQHTRERGPDFAVSYTTHCTFMVEVTRMRVAPPNPESPAANCTTPPLQPQAPLAGPRLVGPPLAGPPPGDRFFDTFCSKMGQMLPQCGNVLIIGQDGPAPAPADLHATMLNFRRRVESDDPAALLRHGFRDRGDFLRHLQRLSVLLIRTVPLKPGDAAVLWDNPQAKVPLPPKARAALAGSHRA